MITRVTVATGAAAILVGGYLAVTPAVARAESACLPNGPVTYTPAPGAAPITVPACPVPTPRGGQPEPTRVSKPRPPKYRKVCGRWWVKGLDKHGHGGTRKGKRGLWHTEPGCRRVRVR